MHHITTKFTLLLLAAITGFSACGVSSKKRSQKTPVGTTQRTAGCLNVVNGKVDDDSYRSTVLLFSSSSGCSGTFISGNTVLTAAHCVDGSSTGGLRLVYGNKVTLGQEAVAYANGVTPLKAIFHEGIYGEDVDVTSLEGIQQDLAILIFESGAAPAVTPLLARDVEDDEEATLVGFGRTVITATPSGSNEFTRRSGKNNVVINSDPGISVYGAVQTTVTNGSATDSNVSFGDSGGTLLIDGKLGGVVSAGGIDPDDTTKAFSYYVDLMRDEAQELFDTAIEAGADIENTGDGGEPNTLNPDADINSDGSGC